MLNSRWRRLSRRGRPEGDTGLQPPQLYAVRLADHGVGGVFADHRLVRSAYLSQRGRDVWGRGPGSQRQLQQDQPSQGGPGQEVSSSKLAIICHFFICHMDCSHIVMLVIVTHRCICKGGGGV